MQTEERVTKHINDLVRQNAFIKKGTSIDNEHINIHVSINELRIKNGLLFLGGSQEPIDTLQHR